MQGMTFLIGMIGAMLAVALKPRQGLAVYAFVVFAYSQRLTVPLGTLDFTTGRLVIIALFLGVLCHGGLRRRIKFSAIDYMVLLAWLAPTLALLKNVPLPTLIERQGGDFLDTVFTYLVARMILRTKEDLFFFIKALVCIGIPLAILGAIESKTGRNPVGFMEPHFAMGYHIGEIGHDMRFGLYRARLTMGIHIIFGLFFTGVVGMVFGLWFQRTMSKPLILIAVFFMLLGAGSSVSSAPVFAIVIAMGVIAGYPLRRYWPVLTFMFVSMVLFVEVFSNRHFYEVLTRFAYDSRTANYRIGLMEECFGGGMTDHWLFGYGYVGIGPGNDNTFFTWEHKDLVNIYVSKLARYGIFGLTPFIILNILYYRSLYKAAKRTRRRADQWLIWCIAAGLIGWNIAMMTVSAMGQVATLLYITIAITRNLPYMLANQPARSRQLAPGPIHEFPGRARSGYPRPIWQPPLRPRWEKNYG